MNPEIVFLIGACFGAGAGAGFACFCIGYAMSSRTGGFQPKARHNPPPRDPSIPAPPPPESPRRQLMADTHNPDLIIKALFERMPPPDTVWPTAEREIWLETLTETIRLVYPDEKTSTDDRSRPFMMPDTKTRLPRPRLEDADIV